MGVAIQALAPKGVRKTGGRHRGSHLSLDPKGVRCAGRRQGGCHLSLESL